VLGPEMRSTGEVMASAGDFPSAFAKAERAAGRRLPESGTAFLSVREADKGSAVDLGRALSTLGFELCATSGTAHTLAAAGLRVTRVRKLSEEGSGPTAVDLVRRHSQRGDVLVVNTPDGSGARPDGYLIREAALVARVPCITTLAGAFAAAEAIARARDEGALSLQERLSA
jgi:carbamoyl-phosphate synthase large subunit